MFQNTQQTPLSAFGEFKLIEHLTKDFITVHPSTIKAVGDDASVIKAGDKAMVISADMLVEGIHFDVMYTPMKHLGFKAISVNVSDITAMNAKPAQVFVSIALSTKYTLEALEELYLGIALACKKYGIDLAGGDTTTIKEGMVISVTATGFAEENKLCYRSGAKENHLIVVSGELGSAYTGLQILEREKSVFLAAPGSQPELDGYDYILEKQLKPEARVDVVELLQNLQVVPSSMIDVSDGLSSELHHICKQSGKGCKIYESKIPIDPQTYNTARELNLDPTMCALNGGEDYELLFTIPINEFDKIKGNPNFSVIGHITSPEQGLIMEAKNGVLVKLEAQGWNHF